MTVMRKMPSPLSTLPRKAPFPLFLFTFLYLFGSGVKELGFFFFPDRRDFLFSKPFKLKCFLDIRRIFILIYDFDILRLRLERKVSVRELVPCGVK